MMSDTLIRNLRVLWRTERIMAEVKLRHLLIGISLKAFAGLIAAFGLLMLEFASYLALVQFCNAITAATILGILNFVLAAIILYISTKTRPDHEFNLAVDVHQAAMQGLQEEVRGIQSRYAEISRNPLTSLLPALLPPLVAFIAQALKKHNKSEKTNLSEMPTHNSSVRL